MNELEQELEYRYSREMALQALHQLSFTGKEAEQFLDAPDDLTKDCIRKSVQERVVRRQVRRLRYHASWLGRNADWFMPALALAVVFLIIGIMWLVI